EQADIPLIFQDFHQVIRRRDRAEGNGTERFRFTGTGLGMPITRALIELQGGTIEVHSVLGQGSTFTISLPISVEAQVGQK
ncbi:MAG: ATP-binding protein, partial [Anaerolineae bacterium]|nr:ATP-binding protein [Anaerolineae bacterium]